jgi:hypothetical protein
LAAARRRKHVCLPLSRKFLTQVLRVGCISLQVAQNHHMQNRLYLQCFHAPWRIIMHNSYWPSRPQQHGTDGGHGDFPHAPRVRAWLRPRTDALRHRRATPQLHSPTFDCTRDWKRRVACGGRRGSSWRVGRAWLDGRPTPGDARPASNAPWPSAPRWLSSSAAMRRRASPRRLPRGTAPSATWRQRCQGWTRDTSTSCPTHGVRRDQVRRGRHQRLTSHLSPSPVRATCG